MRRANSSTDRRRFTRPCVRLAALCLVSIASGAGSAHADANAAKRTAAQALFDEARRLAGEGKHTLACPKFRESQDLDPSIGTLYNLADCHEVTGRTASAWAAFRETADMARVAGQPDRERVARSRADALEPKLMRLNIDVPPEARAPGLVLKRDDVPVGQGQWGVPVPVDPGRHAVVAEAPSREPRTFEVTLSEPGQTVSLRIDPLAEVVAEPPPAPVRSAGALAPAPTADATLPSTTTGESESGGAARGWALALGGVGVLGIAVGSVVALSAKSRYDDSLSYCDAADPNLCSQDGVDLRDSARSRGNIATIAMGLGAAALAGGAVLWFTAPDGANHAHGVRAGAAVAGDGASLMMRGSW